MGRIPTVIDADPLWDMLDGPMPRGVLGLSDPNVHRIDGRWVMFLGGYSSSFRNRLYRATLPAGSTLSQHDWQFERASRGRLGALVRDGRRGAWDAGGMHTPSYVPGHVGHPARIYYAGRRTSKHYGEGSSYAIGMLEELPDGSWSRRPGPVLRGGGDRPSVLEPTVIPVEGGYRMWFLATPHEVGPGEQPDFELRVTDSADGVAWTRPRTFTSASDGYFDVAVYRTGEGWAMLLARGTNLHDVPLFPEQGLWWSHASTPSEDRAAWSAPERILDTDAPSTPGWMGRGVCGPSVAIDGDGVQVFFTGTHRASPWWREAARRALRGGRPPVPAPYHLATGSAELRDGTVLRDPADGRSIR